MREIINLLFAFLLGKKKEYHKLVSIKGITYMIDIHPHEPADKFIARMEEALQKQGLNN